MISAEFINELAFYVQIILYPLAFITCIVMADKYMKKVNRISQEIESLKFELETIKRIQSE